MLLESPETFVFELSLNSHLSEAMEVGPRSQRLDIRPSGPVLKKPNTLASQASPLDVAPPLNVIRLLTHARWAEHARPRLAVEILPVACTFLQFSELHRVHPARMR